MVLTVDEKSKKTIATIPNEGGIERYECSITACENPTCTCGIAYLDLISTQVKDGSIEQLAPLKIEIDVFKKSLDYKKRRKLPKKDLEFAKLFLSKLDENDFQILYGNYFAFKNKISEESSPDSIDAYFEYKEVEQNGLMYAYNDVLPYGDNLTVTINGMQCIIFDQYCLLPHCSCTDTILNIFSVDKIGKQGEELCAVSVKYKNRKWEKIEASSSHVNLKIVRSAVEAQHPNIYRELKKRHLKLKAIYAHCKKRHYAPKQDLQLPKVGRNDPCPCGSGKKFKKCCLVKPN